MRKDTKKLLASYLDSLCPILYINHSDFADVDAELARLAEHDMRFIEFNNALGALNFEDKHPLQQWGLADFLDAVMDEGFDEEHELVIVLKDVHGSMSDPKVVALLRRIAERTLERDDYRAKVIIIASDVVIPHELENFITLMDVPLPDDEEIRDCIHDFAEEVAVKIGAKEFEELVFSLKGLSAFQIKQVLSLAYQGNGRLDASDRKFILSEKEQVIKKSGILEMMNFKETIDDIGGLERLKSWLERKAKIFSSLDKAIKFGVDVPSGILILGMPGCGKSLAAKATATLFKVPLIRLDVGRLMGKYVGESEGNMRRALKLSETVSPCVLWIDEIEKAFAGIGGGYGEVATRLFGHFLTWMQEKESTVFIVATANDISKLPPEFLRKGRFDELFFVDLPTERERRKILEIHLRKRGKLNYKINLDTLSWKTKGFNGADLEGIVKDAIETAFIDGTETITTELLLKSFEDAKSISVIQKEKIEALRTDLKKYDIKPASSEAREATNND